MMVDKTKIQDQKGSVFQKAELRKLPFKEAIIERVPRLECSVEGVFN